MARPGEQHHADSHVAGLAVGLGVFHPSLLEYRDIIGLGLYRFDINFRESAVVGIVGGGGIGATLNTAFDRYEFDSAAAILLVIIGIVMLVEYSSGAIRRWVQ